MLEQEKLIQGVKNKGVADNRIEALLMYGSFTQGDGDRYSDIEFYVFVRDDTLTELDTKSWISEIHPIYAHFFNEFGTQVVIFTNMIRGEFHFHTVSEMPMVEGFREAMHLPDTDTMCLYDKNGLLCTHLQSLKGATILRTDEKAQFAVDNMINNLLFGWNVLQRGEIARSLEILWYVQRYYLQLVRTVQNSMAHWLNATKWLEREILKTYYDTYKGLTAPLCEQDIQDAYIAALNGLKSILPQLHEQNIILDNPAALLSALEKHMTE